jgi:hypothetical protein
MIESDCSKYRTSDEFLRNDMEKGTWSGYGLKKEAA